MQPHISQPLTNAQLELLKTFSHNLSENDLLELRKLLANFFAQKLTQQADKTWDEENWSDEEIDTLLNAKLRKKGE
jgi:hypothetical protein